METRSGLAALSNPERWVKDGNRMARREAAGAFESIAFKHLAESRAFEGLGQSLKAQGLALMERRTLPPFGLYTLLVFERR